MTDHERVVETEAAGRAELTTRAVEERLNAYVTALMDAVG